MIPRLRLDEVRVEGAALEDSRVRPGVAVGSRRARFVPVERVGVLHDELPDPEGGRPAARSSRSFVEKWYQTCGSCLYDGISRAWNVMVSSWDGERTKGRPPPSVSLNTAGIAMRPVRCQSSAGVQHGAEHLLPSDGVHLLADDLATR